ncbi:ATP-binding protein [bacterium]|nr:MAG: ATP-binding protein [bacterium]
MAKPKNALYYEPSRALRSAFPDHWLLETDDYDFDVRDFAEAGHCCLNDLPGLHIRRTTDWHQYCDHSYDSLEDGWQEVEWQGHRMTLLTTGMYSDSCRSTRRFLLAPSDVVGREFFETVGRWSNEIRSEVLVFDNGHWSKSENLYDSIKGTTLDDLVLPAALKDEVRENVRSFFGAEKTYDRYKLPWKRGLLFLGPPGNGKTHMIKGLANELDVPCLYVRSFSSWHYTPHQNISSAFKRARESAPCLFVLEDLDSLIDDRNRSYFLNEMDGFYSNHGILTVATTNHPERVDPAILDRPSRFDRKFMFTLPEQCERFRYLALQNEGLEPSLRLTEHGLDLAAHHTAGFSFAYLKELILSSMMAWIREEGRRPMDEVCRCRSRRWLVR